MKTDSKSGPEAVVELRDPHAPDSVKDENDTEKGWAASKKNLRNILACFSSFFVLGANAGAWGPMVPQLERHYELSYTLVSLVFLSPIVGATSSALLINWIHEHWGRRGVALICSGGHLLAYMTIALHPPFPVVVIAYMLSAFASGIGDAGWNAYLGCMPNANQVLGFLHGFFGSGAVLSPLIASFMVTKGGLPWWHFYYFMMGLAAVEFICLVSTFWHANGAVYRTSVKQQNADDGTESKLPLKEVLVTPPFSYVTWLCSIFLLGYVGVEVALGGWIVVFMTNVRHVSDFSAGMTATGFWLGVTFGRFTLCFFTPAIGEKLAISIYLLLMLGLELVLWLVPQFIVSAVSIALLGFFLGPLFPAAIVVMSRALPRRLHVGAIGFAAAFGSVGATVLPFAVGAIAQVKGVQVLQPISLAIEAAMLCVWLVLLRFTRKV